MDDIRLGRKLATTVKQTLGANNPNVAIIPPDPNRTRLVISTDGAFVCQVWPLDLGIGLQAGFALTPGSPQMTIDVEVWGKMVQASWFAFDNGAGSVITFLASTLEEQ